MDNRIKVLGIPEGEQANAVKSICSVLAENGVSYPIETFEFPCATILTKHLDGSDAPEGSRKAVDLPPLKGFVNHELLAKAISTALPDTIVNLPTIQDGALQCVRVFLNGNELK